MIKLCSTDIIDEHFIGMMCQFVTIFYKFINYNILLISNNSYNIWITAPEYLKILPFTLLPAYN